MILEYKGIDIHYTDQGKGTAVVLLHGFLENSTMWKDLVPEITKKHRAITIDLLGHGETECLGYIHTMEDMADAVHEVLTHLKLRKVVLVGHSMGGYVSLALAEHYPDMIKGLCLVNSTSRADSEERKLNRDRAIKAVKYDYKKFVRMSISNLFRPKNRTIFSEEIKQIKKEALKTPLQGIVAALEGMKIREDREVLLHFSPYKKMLLLGKKDPVLKYEDLKEETENTEVEVIEFPDGHMSYIENKKDFSFKISEFIENL